MNWIICNKCFAPLYRGKRPYHLTQCGHITCQSCLQQVEKQCPQCDHVETMSLALEEPLMPKVIPFFQPLTENLEILLKVVTFHSNQLKITMQRFHDLDKKYEMAKTQFLELKQNFNTLSKNYANLRNVRDKLNKKLSSFAEVEKMQIKPSRFAHHVMGTPSDSGISVQQSCFYSDMPEVTPQSIHRAKNPIISNSSQSLNLRCTQDSFLKPNNISMINRNKYKTANSFRQRL
ncbi:hypothetical protein PUN28_004344 [Cardiocondyla obscurior]